ncbi:CheY-like chemotaxis protein [Bradyrhizobium diazoefficiens]
MADGLSVFLVEDEALIRMMMADMVEELGHHVVAEADNVRDASAFAISPSSTSTSWGSTSIPSPT